MQVWGIYKLRLEQHLIYSSEACVLLDVAKGPGSVGLLRVLTKRIYREHIIRPRLVCKSILIKVLANTSPFSVDEKPFYAPPGPASCKKYLQLIK